MCGIVVSESKVKMLKEGLEKLTKRGPDQTRVIERDNHLFMFNRLAIMGLDENGMQPFFHNEKILVANAEVYNYKQIKEEFKMFPFKGDSDCEVLLPLFEVLDVDMFAYLDAEFAIVLYDGNRKRFVAARDPLGIRPLFYGYNKQDGKIIFASEVKAILDYVEKVMVFPPGHYYLNGTFTKFSTILDFDEYHKDTFDVMLESIRTKLTNAVVKRLDSDAPVGYLLSGGLDSSLVCSIASKYLKKPIRTFSIGMVRDAIDIKYAKQVSDYLGTEHTEVYMTKKEVIASLDEIIYALETYDITTIRASIGMYLLSKYIHRNTDIKVLLTGEVSDELFGYKYTDFAPSEDEFQQECVKRIDEIHMYDVLRADRCLAGNSLEARVPFGDIDFASYVMRINPIYKMNKYSMGKFILRKAFERDYLPSDILYRDKAAFSDAVGHSMVDYIKEYAESYYSDDLFLKLSKKYTETVPFTKESLLYMEIFQKYYPNQEHLVKGYWMPNQDWDGCKVDDPSARVLSNYGDSGK